MKAFYFSLLSAVAVFGLLGCSTSHQANAHSVEYKTLTTLNQSGEGELNSLGKEFWVVVGFTFTPRSQTHSNDEYHYVLKRSAK